MWSLKRGVRLWGSFVCKDDGNGFRNSGFEREVRGTFAWKYDGTGLKKDGLKICVHP